jgi:hypothetical protein
LEKIKVWQPQKVWLRNIKLNFSKKLTIIITLR